MLTIRNITEIHLAWWMIVALVVINTLGLIYTGITLKADASQISGIVVFMIFCLGMAWLYKIKRPEPRLSLLALFSAQLFAYSLAAGILSYLIAAASGQPTIDAWLVAADKAIGLDWLAMFRWEQEHALWHAILTLAYASVLPQLILMPFFLLTKKRFARVREMFWLYVATSLGAIIVSAFFPAEGAFATFKVSMQDPYVQEFLALHNGSLRVIDINKIQGIVQFPSFHLELAVIFIYAARGIPILFPFLLALNTLVIAATPSIGGHHFADLWGGGFLCLSIIALVRWLDSRAVA
jgi:hypothetical protein